MAASGLPEHADEPIVNEEGEQTATENAYVAPAADTATSSGTPSDPTAGSGDARGISGKVSSNENEQKKPWTEWVFTAFVFDAGPCFVSISIYLFPDFVVADFLSAWTLQICLGMFHTVSVIADADA